MTINEKRAIVGLTPIKGMDKFAANLTGEGNESYDK